MLGYRDRLVILMYHRVLRASDPFHAGDVDAGIFDRQLTLLKRFFTVLPLPDAAERLARGELPRRSVCITFDDGYADNVEVALPLLQRHGLSATFFIATGYLDGGRMWNDTVIESISSATTESLDLQSIGLGAHRLEGQDSRQKTIKDLLARLKYLPPREREEQCAAIAAIVGQRLPDNLMMTTQQLLRLHHAGMDVGAHTVTHPILARVSDEESRQEIVGSVQNLRDRLGAPIVSFAYPNGRPTRDYTRRDVELVRQAGVKVAVSTAWGHADARMDRFQLARIAPWEKTTLRFGVRIAHSYFAAPPAVL